MLMFTFIAILQWPSSYFIQNVSLSAGILINEWLVVAGLPFLIAWKLKIPTLEVFPFKKPKIKSLFWLCIMTLSLVVIIDYLTFLSELVFPPPSAAKEVLDKIMHVESLPQGAWRLFLICLTPAFCEEIFFRGFFQNTLGHHWGKNLSLVLTAIAFALIHGMPWYWHLYLLLGFYLSWLLFQTGNLWFPILAHLINNSWTFINHVLENQIPSTGFWKGIDSLVLIVCVVVFALSAVQFAKESISKNY
ncbi:MAG: hypothetical protein A2979_01205 [Deltaproteobacteria bacterium RIFCSPLOWO2_01_FULL_45_74]|nr:MAG: hypothetical protein A2712_05590 [Deltaproteobacteria bacterium RIFCSPHIGHO2_01_FULL_43_49]OGQ14325.1 MAG: hypothetical protein A3D22_04795 [Deltaproteobacteria bacterium RIFCSPHIGHO2_02_FULL_44_53]OGQ27635.1 MAG: hypothetical protein A3D98_09380 [Deltaproteobacteria bacterium RIFCSPHIGHO2_12_FULL_44_21]OGQ30766.1 MAG: hypothetical protein A2979_01205 [Deltaproteobacteria bacterium RIFCSPLOWO2_01_FULL_45_74]